MGFTANAQLVLDTSFAEFGDLADWTLAAGAGSIEGVTVIVDQGVTTPRLGRERIVADKVLLMVRRSEVEAPKQGDLVQLRESGLLFKVMKDPECEDPHRLEWMCEVRETEP